MKRQSVYVDELDSTNRFLSEKNRLNPLPHGFSVRAEFQTAGRGQGTNHWESERGKNLIFSVLLRPDFLRPAHQFLVSQLVALALRDTVAASVTCQVAVKWPNDIYVDDRKIAGILIEHAIAGDTILHSIVGIGLNVNQTQFRSDAPNPVSMKMLAGGELCLESMENAFFDRMDFYWNILQSGDSDFIARVYRQFLFRGEGVYPYLSDGEFFQAEVCDVLPNGHLVLYDTTNGLQREFAFKQVSFVL